jgi:dolichol kinase
MTAGLTKEEVNRKLLHGVAVVLPVGIFYIPMLTDQTRFLVMWLVFLLFLVSLLIDGLRLKKKRVNIIFSHYLGSMMRSAESNQLTGATYVVAGSLICSGLSLISESFAASAFIGLTLFILGDAAAAIVGKGIGRVKIGDKTLEGALGCFIFCFLLSYFVFPIVPQFLNCWGAALTLQASVMVSASVALLELFPIRCGNLTVNDNLYVPGLVCLFAWFIS